MYVDGHTVLCSSGHGPSPVPGHPPPRRPMSQSVRQLPCSVRSYILPSRGRVRVQLGHTVCMCARRLGSSRNNHSRVSKRHLKCDEKLSFIVIQIDGNLDLDRNFIQSRS